MPLMTHHESPLSMGGKRRRAGLLAVIVAVHLAMILWLLMRSAEIVSRPPEATALSLIPLSADQPRAASHPVERTATRAHFRLPSPRPAPTEPPAAAPPPTVNAASGSACDLAAAAGAAIEQDPAAMAELAALPPGIRTEADAVMIWNGDWRALAVPAAADAAVPATSADPAVSELRRAIQALATSAPPACLAVIVPGPLFIPVREPRRTTTLVIGSGAWRWADLLKTPATCVATSAQPCPAVVTPAPIVP